MNHELNTKDLSQQSETALAVMQSFAERERFRKITNIERVGTELMQQGKKVVPNDLMNVFKTLEQRGFGSIIRGRNGKSDRFLWHYNLKEVGKSAMAGLNFTPPSEKQEETEELPLAAEPVFPDEKVTKTSSVKKIRTKSKSGTKKAKGRPGRKPDITKQFAKLEKLFNQLKANIQPKAS